MKKSYLESLDDPYSANDFVDQHEVTDLLSELHFPELDMEEIDWKVDLETKIELLNLEIKRLTLSTPRVIT